MLNCPDQRHARLENVVSEVLDSTGRVRCLDVELCDTHIVFLSIDVMYMQVLQTPSGTHLEIRRPKAETEIS